MEKINIAELLKDCPEGMELDCTTWENVTFEKVVSDKIYIKRNKKNHLYDDRVVLNQYGCTTNHQDEKCRIFPKGKTTWDGFHRPFKDGDIVITKTSNNFIFYSIYKGIENRKVLTYVDYKPDYNRLINANSALCYTCEIIEQRLATEEEKVKFFQAIKENGYRWNAETKTLEKLAEPKFKIEKGKWYVCTKDLLDNYANKAFCKGDTYLSTQDGSLISLNSNVPFEVVCASTYFRDWTINDAKDGDVLFHSDSASNGIFIFKEILQCGTMQKVICYCDYDSEDGFCLGENHTCCWTDSKILHPATKEQRDLLFQKMKEEGYKWNAETKTLGKLPKFKVGNRIKSKERKPIINTITKVCENHYELDDGGLLPLNSQDKWELVLNKFDITTLKPFTEVLVRHNKDCSWLPSLFGLYDKGKSYPYICCNGFAYKYCIPYKGNQHLRGTTNDCDEYYKVWE